MINNYSTFVFPSRQKVAVFFVCTLLLVAVLIPFVSLAAGVVPCNKTLVNGKFTDPCDFDKFVTLGNNIIDFLLYSFATPFAIILFMWAGFLFMFKSSSEGDITKAKTIFWNVLLGFIIALAAFLIIKLILLGLEAEIPQQFRG